MEINDVLAINGTEESTTQLSDKELGKDDFMKLMLAQFKYQDPLEPLKNEQLVLQLAQFSTLESTQNLTNNFDNFMINSNISTASNLVGKEVVYLDGGLSVTGVIDKVNINGSEMGFIVDGVSISGNQLISIGGTVPPTT